MKLITRAVFAEMAHASRAAITKAIREERLNIVEGGKTGRIDPNCYKSIQYLKMAEIQRDNKIKKPVIKKPVKRKASKPRKPKPKPKPVNNIIDIHRADKRTQTISRPQDKKIVPLKHIVPTGPKPEQPEPPRKLTQSEKHLEELKRQLEDLGHRFNIAKTIKIEEQATSEKLKNARIRGELIDREKIYNNIFTYLDKLHSNLERLADSFLSDVGPLMIDAGKVMPEHRSNWKNEVLSQIDEGKKDMVKMLKKIQKEQSK